MIRVTFSKKTNQIGTIFFWTFIDICCMLSFIAIFKDELLLNSYTSCTESSIYELSIAVLIKFYVVLLMGGETRITPSPLTKSIGIFRFVVRYTSSYVSSSISTVVTVSSTSPRIMFKC